MNTVATRCRSRRSESLTPEARTAPAQRPIRPPRAQAAAPRESSPQRLGTTPASAARPPEARSPGAPPHAPEPPQETPATHRAAQTTPAEAPPPDTTRPPGPPPESPL